MKSDKGDNSDSICLSCHSNLEDMSDCISSCISSARSNVYEMPITYKNKYDVFGVNFVMN